MPPPPRPKVPTVAVQPRSAPSRPALSGAVDEDFALRGCSLDDSRHGGPGLTECSLTECSLTKCSLSKPRLGGFAGSDSGPRGGPGLRVAIMADEVGWHTRQLQRALRARGAQGRCLDLAQCEVDTGANALGLVLPGWGARLPDAVLVRGIAGGSFEQVTRRLGFLHALRQSGIPVYNEAAAIERSVDKAATSLLLHAAGLPTPPTWSMESLAQAQRRVQREAAAGHAVVMKPLFGSQGNGLLRAGWVDGVFTPLTMAPGGLYYLQRFVPPHNAPGYDWRVMVVGGEARAAMRRTSVHWVHNVAQGAQCGRQSLLEGAGPELARLAKAACAALGLHYAGVDLMPTPQGPCVIEVNGVAAWAGLQRVTDFNIAQALVDDLLRHCAPARAAA